MPIYNALADENQNALSQAAFGFFPQLRRNRTVQDPRAALDMPVQALRGRLAATAGMPSDILNMLRTPMPMEMYGNVDYGPQTQVPYGSQELLKTLPLPPQGPAQEAAANLGTLAPLTPMEALQAARVARQAALASKEAAVAGGKALAPVAGDMLMNYMVKQKMILPLDVYHGSPHRFPPTARNPLGEFDASKIGTGEGAQVYGHGLYTAEAPAVATEYQRQLGTQMKYKGEQFYDPIVGKKTGTTGNTELDDYLLSYLGDTGVIRKELLTAAKEMRSAKNPQAVKEYQALMGELRKVRSDVTAANTGSLYKVDLPDEQIAKMLDYDKTWKQQPKNVQDAINIDSLLKYYGTDDISTSQVLYHAKQNMSPAAFAEFLRSKGVPGVKYFDEKSRAAGEGTRNFVIFPGEEKSMTILERNGQSANALVKNR
jgi:hypothetical protein